MPAEACVIDLVDHEVVMAESIWLYMLGQTVIAAGSRGTANRGCDRERGGPVAAVPG